jgi:arylamine N-acetyltransferase
VIREGDDLVLQTLRAQEWSDVYSFPPRRALPIDIEVSNWWICTNPASPFVSGLIVSINHGNGRREAMYDWSGPLVTMTPSPSGTEVADADWHAVPTLLAERFGLPGFGLGPDGRLVAVH